MVGGVRLRFADGSLIDDGYFGICLKTSPYTYLGQRPLRVGREASLEPERVFVRGVGGDRATVETGNDEGGDRSFRRARDALRDRRPGTR